MSPTGLAELYASHAPRARGLAFLLTGDAALAEDLVQDCFVRLAGRVLPVADPGAYLRWSSTPPTATTAGSGYDGTGPGRRGPRRRR